MDGCSWPPYQARDGARAVFSADMPWHKASNSSCDDSNHLHREREEQLQQQLEQIYMLMDMELEHEVKHTVPPQTQSLSQQQRRSSPSSSPLGSFAVSSDETSSLVLSASSTATTFCQQQPPAEASSLDTPFSPLPYSYLDTIPDLEEIMSQARHKQDSHADSGTSAFRQYVRHLRPKKKLKQGSCGQRAIKTAMSVLAKMHSAKIVSQWQSQSSQAEMTLAVPSDESKNIQLQHVLSERKRRGKINDSFDALKNALPPSSKRDKTSILMRARDYILSLKSRVSELEENRMALESQLCIDYGDEQDVIGSRENIGVEIISLSKAVAEETTPEENSGKVKM